MLRVAVGLALSVVVASSLIDATDIDVVKLLLLLSVNVSS